MKLEQHRQAIELVRDHPGWSDRRIAAKLGVSPSTVGRWRWQAGYPAATKKATSTRRRRLVP